MPINIGFIVGLGMIWSVSILAASDKPYLANPKQPLCHGPAKAPWGLVYLHGIDTIKPSAQELTAREDLKKLANKMGFRLAIVRSPWECSSRKGQLCWPYRAPEELQKTLTYVQQSAAKCLPDSQPQVLYGFSNAGYFAGQIVARCVAHPFHRIVMTGAAGDPPAKGKKLTTCGRLDVMMGKGDMTLKKARNFYQTLRRADAKVTLTVFPGGHRVDAPALEGILTQAPLAK